MRVVRAGDFFVVSSYKQYIESINGVKRVDSVPQEPYRTIVQKLLKKYDCKMSSVTHIVEEVKKIWSEVAPSTMTVAANA